METQYWFLLLVLLACIGAWMVRAEPQTELKPGKPIEVDNFVRPKSDEAKLNELKTRYRQLRDQVRDAEIKVFVQVLRLEMEKAKTESITLKIGNRGQLIENYQKEHIIGFAETTYTSFVNPYYYVRESYFDDLYLLPYNSLTEDRIKNYEGRIAELEKKLQNVGKDEITIRPLYINFEMVDGNKRFAFSCNMFNCDAAVKFFREHMFRWTEASHLTFRGELHHSLKDAKAIFRIYVSSNFGAKYLTEDEKNLA